MANAIHPVYLVVDARDKWESGLNNFIELLSTSLEKSVKVRWLASSRPEVDVLAAWKNQKHWRSGWSECSRYGRLCQERYQVQSLTSEWRQLYQRDFDEGSGWDPPMSWQHLLFGSSRIQCASPQNVDGMLLKPLKTFLPGCQNCTTIWWPKSGIKTRTTSCAPKCSSSYKFCISLSLSFRGWGTRWITTRERRTSLGNAVLFWKSMTP